MLHLVSRLEQLFRSDVLCLMAGKFFIRHVVRHHGPVSLVEAGGPPLRRGCVMLLLLPPLRGVGRPKVRLRVQCAQRKLLGLSRLLADARVSSEDLDA